MKVILYKEVPKLGDEDTLADVAPGYARNYLFPKKLARQATPAALAALEKRQEEKKKIMEAKRGELEELAKKLSSLEISIAADAGEGGKLFGSVTSQDIAAEVSNAAGLDIDKKKIELNEPLKVLGEYSVNIKLYQDIAAKLKVKVVAK